MFIMITSMFHSCPSGLLVFITTCLLTQFPTNSEGVSCYNPGSSLSTAVSQVSCPRGFTVRLPDVRLCAEELICSNTPATLLQPEHKQVFYHYLLSAANCQNKGIQSVSNGIIYWVCFSLSDINKAASLCCSSVCCTEGANTADVSFILPVKGTNKCACSSPHFDPPSQVKPCLAFHP